MKLPKKIHFCGHDFPVTEVAHLDGDDNWGRTDLARMTIKIEKDLCDSKKRETLIHEMLHIALRASGFFTELSVKDEEKHVKAWAVNIYGILKDNNFLK